ncbi:uncharacterized protein LOC18422352 isoform X1 [Amborella trichopoda]|uniref:uncharacterized protein LOC18422352 isoform X1 n=2 Tax=Amborella trichopoda TaxID=13333 RepID=UPI0005D450B2|nr:uncharacterized protein LOC18422352 isoform X1 [Amborella trichopoda]|eukprot:XP_011621777.1 uncharacterized protein LOC18422352 isoform X1 [Amborella trichopoda]
MNRFFGFEIAALKPATMAYISPLRRLPLFQKDQLLFLLVYGKTHFPLPSLHRKISTSPILFTDYSSSKSQTRETHFKIHGLRLPQSDIEEVVFESPLKKSRNEKKREARRAVQWGMELADFSPPQINLILRAASLELEIYDAIMLVKRLGPDVREGKRRQFNYIGRLLRNVQPELMENLIQATKDGDHAKLHALSGQRTQTIVNEEEIQEEEDEEEETDIEEEAHPKYIELADRWFQGLINKNSSITNEVYSVQDVDFDRQELRKLVRRVQTMQGRTVDDSAADSEAALRGARKSLSRFLRSLAKQTLMV